MRATEILKKLLNQLILKMSSHKCQSARLYQMLIFQKMKAITQRKKRI